MTLADGNDPITATGAPVDLFLLQMILIVACCRLLAMALKYIKQPSVIAEVITGIVLGPSAFGYIPGFTKNIFPTASVPTLNVVANWGLILFMFMVGLELDPALIKTNARRSILVSAAAMITPFCLGLLSSLAIYDTLVDKEKVSYADFILFVGVAMSITAFPVLARILTETKLIHTRVGSLALGSAAVDDVVAWCLLALVVALSRSASALEFLYVILMLAGFIVFAFIAIRPLLTRIARLSHSHQELQFTNLVFLLVLVLTCAFYTDIIGVHSIFGAFVIGVITPRENRFAFRITERIEDLVMTLLLPLYFTYSGLQTNISALNDGIAWAMVILAIVTACVGKILGATFTSRLLGNTWRESVVVGILMNTKGLVELIVLNIGLQVGVLSTKTFTVFVLMALFTTFITTPLVHFIWIRHQAKESGLSKHSDKYSVLLCVPDLRAGLGMVNVAHTLQGGYETFRVKAVHLNEISERPSSYFFDIAEKMRDRPLVGSKTKNPLLEALKQHASEMGMNMKTKVLTSHEITNDIVRFSKKQNFDFVILGWNDPYFVEQDLEASPSEKGAITQLKSSFGVMLDRGLSSMFGHGIPSSQIVQQAVQRISTSVGVLVDKQGERPIPVKSVLFPYCGNDFEQAALDLVLRMSGQIVITLVDSSQGGSLHIPEKMLEVDEKEFGTTVPLEGPSSAAVPPSPHTPHSPRIRVIRTTSGSAYQDALIEIKRKPFDLVLVGVDRRTRGSTSDVPSVADLVKSSPVSVLMVYPAVGSGSGSGGASPSNPPVGYSIDV